MRRINPERPLTPAERTARYREKHPEKIRAQQAAYKKADPARHLKNKRDWFRRHPHVRLAQLARARAKKLGLECTITRDDVFVPDLCPALGIPLFVGDTGLTDNSPTIDRIDNSRGYTPDNIVVVSWRANRIKSNVTVDDLVAVAAFYGKWRAAEAKGAEAVARAA